MKLEEVFETLFFNIEKELSGNSDDQGFPDFTTTECGKQVLFNRESKLSILNILDILNENEKKFENKIGQDALIILIRKHIAELFVLNRQNDACFKGIKKEFKKRLFKDIENRKLEFTHHFPASSLFTPYANSSGTFVLGPIQIKARGDWLESVDFHPNIIDNYANQKEINAKWKEQTTQALLDRKNHHSGSLANTVIGAIENSFCLISVSINGYELTASKKHAEIIAKSALDSISLLLGGDSLFFQQVLYTQPMPPISHSTLLSQGDYLAVPGMTLGKQIPLLSPKDVCDALKESEKIVKHIELALNEAVAVSESSNSPLYQRWFTALDWYAEGCRESNDSIALAKIATSLDVLSNGGKFKGILQMVSNLLHEDIHKKIPFRNKELSLNDVIKEIYDNGRSKILHGNQVNRLETDAVINKLAKIIARNVLLSSIQLIKSYTGSDKQNAFRYIKPWA